MSQITTHILDTSKGKPASGVTIHLQQFHKNGWDNIASGITNQDGRIPNLLPDHIVLSPGVYCMVFETGPYFDAQKILAFYPTVRIEFETFDESHYHIPLLLNPFGYSTYRGS